MLDIRFPYGSENRQGLNECVEIRLLPAGLAPLASQCEMRAVLKKLHET